MPRHRSLPALIGLTIVSAVSAAQQPTLDPFPTPIETTQGVVAVNFVEFATIPDVNGEAPRLMHLVDEPGTRRIFVSVMTGQLYSISYDGKVVRGCGEFRERSRNSRYQGGSVLNRKSFRYSSRLDSSSVALPSKRMRPSCRTMNSARATESASAGTIRTRPSSLTAWWVAM